MSLLTSLPLELTRLEPVPTLLSRMRSEISASFLPDKPIRISRAPGRLDVMGGIADYTGSLVCEATLNRAAAVALQARDDRNVQVFSFNLFDDHLPCTLMVPLDVLADASYEELRAEFKKQNCIWAGYLAGCLAVLHREGYLNLKDPAVMGMNIALYSTIPLGAGVSSSAAIEVATMMNIIHHFNIHRLNPTEIHPMRVAMMCQRVENLIVGAPCGIMDQSASCAGQAGAMMLMLCQPCELHQPLHMPKGVRAIGINSNVKHSVGGGMYGRTRCAAFMGHRIILDAMKKMGHKAGRELVADPMNGYLANLAADDYKKLFRPLLPESCKGGSFLLEYGGTIDKATTVEPDFMYHVQNATDHHVLEAMRVKKFVKLVEDAYQLGNTDPERKKLLDMAGHLMYASHSSYNNDAKLGAAECDVLVDLVRENEHHGLYGAKITGGGSGGTVAVLCDDTPEVDETIMKIMSAYQQKTGRTPEFFRRTSPGAWAAGTVVV